MNILMVKQKVKNSELLEMLEIQELLVQIEDYFQDLELKFIAPDCF